MAEKKSIGREQAMYAIKNYKTKKLFIKDFEAGTKIGVWQSKEAGPHWPDGRTELVGPHPPAASKWRVMVQIRSDVVASIIS